MSIDNASAAVEEAGHLSSLFMGLAQISISLPCKGFLQISIKEILLVSENSFRMIATITHLKFHREKKHSPQTVCPIYTAHDFANTIVVGAGKFLGVQMIFARISPNLLENFWATFVHCMKTVFQMTPEKNFFMSFHFGRHFLKPKHAGRHFFHIKTRWAPCLLAFSGSMEFVKVFTDFAQISTYFARIFREFARIFTKSKLLGVRLHPCAPASDTTG